MVFVAVIKHSTSTFTQVNKNQTRVPRRTSRVTNPLLMRENIRLSSLTLDASHVRSAPLYLIEIMKKKEDMLYVFVSFS